MARIELTHVTKRWGGFYAVDDLSMLIDDNDFVTLLGPSGCGKTTTLRMIAGLETPTTGKIVIDDVTVFDSDAGINIPPNKRRVGFLFQNYALWPNMTVYQNIAFGLSNIKEAGLSVNENGELIRNPSEGGVERKLTKEEIDKIIARVSAIVKIQPFMERYPGELSGGQQQRVAIARTLAPGPRVLFMDEPLSNLDAKLRLEMRSELQRLHLSTGSTFVYVTHDQMEAMTLATRICLINNGVLQQYDEPLTVYNRPNNTFIADFVGNPAINFINARGNQKNDGSFHLKFLDNYEADFIPTEKINVTEWYSSAEKEIAAFNAKERPAEKTNKDLPFNYPVAVVSETEKEQRELDRDDWVIGIRPEFIKICEDGPIEGEIFSAMPTGMETTVRIRVSNYLLTGVVFGGVLYKIGQKIKLAFTGDGATLFSRVNGRFVGCGRIGQS
ncbi:MAG: ABC transporter ATP-binding protein [Synergistaceae bacterium]|nr:ABC transporter ATP-binding protein [Synergistaceae bacterium]MBQ6002645.1 ABC transporter ATP-binding protein [Synergistaceae bacterium]MBQ6417680.1 ABC transporter ATP-binding protein [Synergistaceae bacterium]MBQ6663978.1 ABC transporter ATP-binding protein [Synergistaceae bacterium]MBR0186141.1 ABC transporter ATP-binding protein [Synergistaceae bacterium]